jgi:cytochrome b subunit of formate dehydrogenase
MMLAASNPASSVHASNVANSCRSAQCHPGADIAIAAAAVHLDLPNSYGTLEFLLAAAFIVLTIATFGPSAVIVILELFQLIAGTQHRGGERTEELARTLMSQPHGRRRLIRFTVGQRVQHWFLVLLFTALAVTGFPMKFADRDWARVAIEMFGGLQIARLVHHWCGIALAAGFVFHLLYVLWTVRAKLRSAPPDAGQRGLVRNVLALPMWIGPQDLKKAGHLLAYLLFLRRDPPTFGRFSVKEKFEYIGVFWGTTLLGLTGMILWGEQISSRLLSGRMLNIAMIAHTYEAFLAVIHVGVLHICNVIFAPNVFPLSPATLTGNTPIAELAENHGEFVADVARDLGLAGPGEERP